MACLCLSEEGRKALCLLFELFEIRDVFLLPVSSNTPSALLYLCICGCTWWTLSDVKYANSKSLFFQAVNDNTSTLSRAAYDRGVMSAWVLRNVSSYTGKHTPGNKHRQDTPKYSSPVSPLLCITFCVVSLLLSVITFGALMATSSSVAQRLPVPSITLPVMSRTWVTTARQKCLLLLSVRIAPVFVL